MMAKPAQLFIILCIAGSVAAEPTLSRCNRTANEREPNASIVVYATANTMSATVQFNLNEVSYAFELETRSAFAADGVVRTVSSNGNRDSHPRHERVHTYRVREGDVHARALVSDSGEVRGLFRQGEVVVYLEPSKNPEGEPATGVWHDLYILAGPSTAPNRTSSGSRSTSTPSLRGSVNSVEASESNVFTSDGTADPSWAGDRFYPGCYPGDSTMHSMKLRIYTDVQVHNEHPGQVQSLVESAILSASYVYENQLNVELLVEELIIYTDAASAPDWAKDCDDHGEGTFMDYKFNHVYDENKEDVIAMQAFTGCGTGSGWVGVAWVGTTCDIFNGPNGIGRYNFGLNQLQDAGDWLTFAHELGHNLGADHAFDEGQGSTGGIMDYYVGGIHDGVVQFNVDYTKDELCTTFTNMGISCPAEQWFENPTTSTTTTTTAAPPTTTTTTVATTPPPTTTTTAAQTQPTTTTTTAAPTTTTTTIVATTPPPTTTTTAAQTQPTTTTTTAAPTTTTTTTVATTPPPTTTTTAAQTQPTTTTTTAAPTTTTTTTVATTPPPTTTTTAAQTQPTTTTTAAQTQPATTTSSHVAGGWEVSGDCTRDVAEPQCIQSPNYPNKYSDGQQCTIQVLDTTVPIRVDFFNVKWKDAMIIDGTYYRQRNGPDGVVPQSDIRWSSNNDGRVRKGWRICRDI